MKLNLGSGPDYREGMINVEHPFCKDLYKADVYEDLEHAHRLFKKLNVDGQVDEIHAYHVLEHVTHLHNLMHHCWKALKPSGMFYIRVPYCFHLCAWGDPTHVRAFQPESFTKFLCKKGLQEHRETLFEILKIEVWEDGQILCEMKKL